MFFIISKIFYFILQPINWILLLLLWSVLTKSATRKRQLLRGVFFLTLLLTNPFFAYRVFHAWEYPHTPIENVRDTFHVGIVLGGYSDFSNYCNDERLNFNPASNRLLDAVALYKKGIIKKILISGGDGDIMRQKIPEAAASKPFLWQLGVKEEDILLENESKNTYENALFCKKYLDTLPQKGRVLLITSAFHLRRAEGCFRKQNIDIQPFASHFIAKRFAWNGSRWLIPQSDVLHFWEIFIKEWLGYATYKMKGYL
jgi:uncharacterized SAM-binding protein YcdF (DUF218 family)